MACLSVAFVGIVIWRVGCGEWASLTEHHGIFDRIAAVALALASALALNRDRRSLRGQSVSFACSIELWRIHFKRQVLFILA